MQHYGDTVLDSSMLRMATVGAIGPTDPMWLSTLDAMEAELVVDSLVYRYDPAASPDGLAGDEGTFSLCTFNYVDALARAGRLDEARLIFEKMLTYANHVGLFSEEIGRTGQQLGNFPQAFTHLALIDAAITLDAALDRAKSNRRYAAVRHPGRAQGGGRGGDLSGGQAKAGVRRSRRGCGRAGGRWRRRSPGTPAPTRRPRPPARPRSRAASRRSRVRSH